MVPPTLRFLPVAALPRTKGAPPARPTAPSRLPPGARIAYGPGPFDVGFVWGDEGDSIHVTDGERSWPTDAPPNGEYARRHVFSPDGRRLLLFTTFLLRELDLAEGRVRIVCTAGGLLAARYLADRSTVGLTGGDTCEIDPSEPDSVEMARWRGEPTTGRVGWRSRPSVFVAHADRDALVAAFDCRAEAIETLRAGRVIVVRRHEGYAGWRTAVLAYDEGGFAPLGLFDRDVGQVFEADGVAYAAGGYRLDGLDDALAAVVLPPPVPFALDDRAPGDAVPGSTAKEPRTPSVDLPPEREGVCWAPEAAARLSPRRRRAPRQPASPGLTPARTLEEISSWLRRSSGWDETGAWSDEAGVAISARVLRRYRARMFPPRASDVALEAACAAMLGDGAAQVRDGLVDWWVLSAGLSFAVCALSEVWAFRAGERHAGGAIPWLKRPGWPPNELVSELDVGHPFATRGFERTPSAPRPWRRLREHLAAASCDQYEGARAAASEIRSRASLPVRVALAYAFADEDVWARADATVLCGLPAEATPYGVWLLGALTDAPLATAIAARYPSSVGARAFCYDLVDGLGTGAVAPLTSLRDGGLASTNKYVRPALLADVVRALALIRTGETFAALVPMLADDAVSAQVAAHLRAHPAGALPALRAQSRGRERAAKRARELFDAIAAAHPGEAAALPAAATNEAEKKPRKRPPAKPSTDVTTVSEGAGNAPIAAGPPVGGTPVSTHVATTKPGEASVESLVAAWAEVAVVEAERSLCWPRAARSRVWPPRARRDELGPPPLHDAAASFAVVAAAYREVRPLWVAGFDDPGQRGEDVALVRAVDGLFTAGESPAAFVAAEQGAALVMLGTETWSRRHGRAVKVADVARELVRLWLATGGVTLVLDALVAGWHLARVMRGDAYNGEVFALRLVRTPYDPGERPGEGEGYSWRAGRSFDLRPGPWSRLRGCVLRADDADYARARARAAAHRASAPPPLRAAISYAFADETEWVRDDVDTLLAVAPTVPRYARNLIALCPDLTLATRLYDAARATPFPSYAESIPHHLHEDAAQLVERFGPGAASMVTSLLGFDTERRPRHWGPVQEHVYGALSVIVTSAVAETLIGLLAERRPEAWSVVAGYVLRAPEAAMGAAARWSEIPTALAMLLAAGFSQRPAAFVAALDRLAPSKAKDLLADLARRVGPPTGEAADDALPPAIWGARPRRKRAATPAFVDPLALPRPLVVGTRDALSRAAVGLLVDLFSRASEPTVRDALDAARARLDPTSLAVFAEAVSANWHATGANLRDRWAEGVAASHAPS